MGRRWEQDRYVGYRKARKEAVAVSMPGVPAVPALPAERTPEQTPAPVSMFARKVA